MSKRPCWMKITKAFFLLWEVISFLAFLCIFICCALLKTATRQLLKPGDVISFFSAGNFIIFSCKSLQKKSFVLSSNMVALSCVYKKCCGYMPSSRKGWQDSTISWSYNTFYRGIWKGNTSARNCWRISVVVLYSLDKLSLWTQNQVDWEGMTWKNFTHRGSYVYPWIFFNFNRLFLNLLLSTSSNSIVICIL